MPISHYIKLLKIFVFVLYLSFSHVPLSVWDGGQLLTFYYLINDYLFQ